MQTYALKFIVIGDSGVGKSQLSRRFAKKPFKEDSQSTVGMEFCTREIPFEKCLVKAQIWDTAGQERFESMTKAYYKDAVGAMLVYDVTNPASFQNLKSVWMNQVHKYGHEKMSLVLVGNKADFKEMQRQVSRYDAAAFAESKRIDFIETSALTGENVENAFRRLVLSVTKLIPAVKIHLDLTGLPEGWISTFKPYSSELINSTNNNNAVSALNQTNVAGIAHCASAGALALQSGSISSSGGGSPKTKERSPSGNFKSNSNRVVDISCASPTNNVVSSRKNSYTSRPSTPNGSSSPVSNAIPITPNTATSDAVVLFESNKDCDASTEMNSSVGSTNSTPEMITIYTNYWTGEETLEVPKSFAPTGFLFESKLNLSNARFSEFDEPVNRNNASNEEYLSGKRNSIGQGNKNVIVSKSTAITTKAKPVQLKNSNEPVQRKKSGISFSRCCTIS